MKEFDSQVIALIKPQFEAGRKAAAVHAGVIKDRDVHAQVLSETLTDAIALGFWPSGLVLSPITGPKGNIEFLVNLFVGDYSENIEIDQMIETVLRED